MANKTDQKGDRSEQQSTILAIEDDLILLDTLEYNLSGAVSWPKDPIRFRKMNQAALLW